MLLVAECRPGVRHNGVGLDGDAHRGGAGVRPSHGGQGQPAARRDDLRQEVGEGDVPQAAGGDVSRDETARRRLQEGGSRRGHGGGSPWGSVTSPHFATFGFC